MFMSVKAKHWIKYFLFYECGKTSVTAEARVCIRKTSGKFRF